jgi:hypothetical protein
MAKSSLKDRRRAKKQKEVARKKLINAGIGLVVVGILGFIIWGLAKPAVGDSHEIEGQEHVDEGSPITWQSNPPTSGDHYSSPMPAGIYNENSPEVTSSNPEGYLIHSLEHGYIIFWYNCDEISADECATLQSEVRSVMSSFGNQKLIAWPWPALDGTIAMTSWGHTQNFEKFDPEVAKEFIKTNRTRAPEPNAP